jgi:hypothetical protein
MSNRAYSESDLIKLRELIDQGVQVTSDIKNLKESLSEVIAAVSEELEIPKTILNKTIKVAFKMGENQDELEEGREELDAVEEILQVVGKTK